MTAPLRAAAAALALAAAFPALAEDAPRRFGLGVSLRTDLVGALAGVPAAQIVLPMQLTPYFRVEPAVGLGSLDDGSPTSAGVTSSRSVGVGMFLVTPVAPRVDAYAGARVALQRSVTRLVLLNSPATVESDQLVIAPAAGAECRLGPAFSLGLEVQLQYVAADLSISIGGAADGSMGVGTLSTGGLVFLRAYLF